MTAEHVGTADTESKPEDGRPRSQRMRTTPAIVHALALPIVPRRDSWVSVNDDLLKRQATLDDRRNSSFVSDDSPYPDDFNYERKKIAPVHSSDYTLLKQQFYDSQLSPATHSTSSPGSSTPPSSPYVASSRKQDEKKRCISRRARRIIILVVVFLLCFAAGAILVRFMYTSTRGDDEKRALHEADSACDAIQRRIDHFGVGTRVAAAAMSLLFHDLQSPEISERADYTFVQYAQTGLKIFNGTLAWMLAPNAVVQRVFPPQYNKYIGNNMNFCPVRSPAISGSLGDKQLGMGGPFTDAEGFLGIWLVSPVYFNNTWWGHVAVSLPLSSLLVVDDGTLDQNMAKAGYDYVLSSQDGNGTTMVIQSRNKESISEAISYFMDVPTTPTGRWILSVSPAGGWLNKVSWSIWASIPIGFVIISIFIVFLNIVLKSPEVLEVRVAEKTKEVREAGLSLELYSRELERKTSELQLKTVELEGQNYQIRELQRAYAKFVPFPLIKLLDKSSILEVQSGDYVARTLTVLFADIWQFTTISEGMSPRSVFDFLNTFLCAIGPVIRENGGIIDKYMGDGFMSIFTDASAAIRTAVAMQKKLGDLNSRFLGSPRYYREDADTRDVDGRRLHWCSEEVKLGIGIHTGPLIVGCVGFEERMDCTVTSDSVNVASRLECLTRIFSSSIIISEETVHNARLDSQRSSSHLRRYLGEVKVKGRNVPVKVHEIYTNDNDLRIAKKNLTKASFEQAVSKYSSGEWDRAQSLFLEVLEKDPEDEAARVYSQDCVKQITSGATCPGTSPGTSHKDSSVFGTSVKSVKGRTTSHSTLTMDSKQAYRAGSFFDP
mmetsp:Transcript_36136/g.58418  ORF Transcript_36136/g.58418 Transcript_36136/m.58418 type:complete len:832 (+) Transcript_36136:228-2723(+)